MILATHGIVGSQIVQIDPDYLAFYNRVITAGGSLSTTEQTATQQLVKDLKSYGIWTKMKAIYPMVGGGSGTTAARQAACSQNLKSSSFTGTFTSGWTFASTGAKGDGSASYMDTGLSPLNDLSNNNSHLSYYSRNTSTGSFPYLMGMYDTSVSPNVLYKMNMGGTTDFYGTLGNVNQSNTGNISTNNTGFFLIKRETNNNQKAYIDSTLISTVTQNYTVMSAYNIYLNALNINGSAGLFSNYECAFSSIGDGLTDQEADDFYTAVQAFQTTLSRNV